ncbi:MAG TPA: Gfo/Idh/MocA family oxidoreductase [Phycisphaerae bacterium]|nr:Gfo/Idh/MocA family oxidoreductase [Phycisphaerae bacterium]
MTPQRKRYAQVGIGGRSHMYTMAIVGPYAATAELVGLCDVNQGRMDLRNRQIAQAGAAPVATYGAEAFDTMVRQARPDVVIVTTVDATHSDYICRAMELGCDVIAEKPMTTDEVRCRRILRTIAATGRRCTVTFNYRYAPSRSQVRELLAGGAIGEVLSVDFAWLLDTRHGADYFRRWHRRREHSGSLLVHKATHHFDGVNWWLDDVPEEVFAHGSLRYYTPETGDRMGLADRGERCHGCPASGRCRFVLDLAGTPDLKETYLDCEAEDGYFRDRCVFSPQINIWDSMTATVRYRRGTLLSYHLHAYSPYEGYKIAFNGTRGRLEHTACENTYISGDGTVPGELARDNVSITLIPEFAKPQTVEVHLGEGGHGGGDEPLLADVLAADPPADPLRRAASHRDGAYSILIGVAAAKSIDSGQPVRIADLLGDAPM